MFWATRVSQQGRWVMRGNSCRRVVLGTRSRGQDYGLGPLPSILCSNWRREVVMNSTAIFSFPQFCSLGLN